MTPEQLKASILQYAIQGKLVEQRPEEGTAEDLYKSIQEEKQKLIKEGKLKKTRALPLITEEEIPFDFPKTWKICYIDDIAFVTKLAGFEYTKYIADNLVIDGIPLFKGKNVQNGKLVLEFESFIPESVSDELPRSQITKKCLLTPYVGTIGNIAIFDGTFKAHLGSNVGKIEILNSNDNTFVLEEYLLWYLRSQYGYNELTKYKKATAQESISIDAIRNVIIAIPPLEEQHRIVAKIEELLPYVDRYAASYEKLEQFNAKFPEDMKKSILQYAIQGKLVEQRPEEGTAEELLSQISSKKEQLIKEKILKKTKPLEPIIEEEIPFDLPQSWKWVKWGDIVNIVSARRVHQTDWQKEGIPFYRAREIAEMSRNNGQVDNELFISEELYNEFSVSGIPKPGDIMVTAVGTLGKTYIVKNGDKFYYKDASVICFENHFGLCSEYLAIMMDTPLMKQQIKSNSDGTTVATLTMVRMNEYLFPLPPLAEQYRIVAKIEELLPYCDKLIK